MSQQTEGGNSGTHERKSGFAPVEGTELYFEVQGEGPGLLLLNELNLDCRMWDYQFDYFSRWFRVVRYDHRGHGRSPKTKGGLEVYSEANDAHALLRHLGLEGVSALGIAQGSRAALELALEHPSAVRALVLVPARISGFTREQIFQGMLEVSRRINPSGGDEGSRHLSPENIGRAVLGAIERVRELRRSPPPESQFARELEEGLRRSSPMVEAHIRGDVAGMVRPLMADPEYAPGEDQPEARRKVEQLLTDSYSRGELSLPRPVERVMERLSEVRVPTLVMVGEREGAAVRSTAEALVSGIAGARMVVVRDAPRLMNLAQPEEFNRIVLEFLSEALGSAQG